MAGNPFVARRLRAGPRLAALRGQVDNADIGATEPAAELAVDVLQHHRIGVDVGFIERVEVSGREFVKHGRALGDDAG